VHRPSLSTTLRSLLAQTRREWKAIVVFDGCQPDEKAWYRTDARIQVMCIEKTGESKNYAGNVRNRGMERVDTEWVAFVDDDDVLSSSYVEFLYRERMTYPHIPCILFRMSSREEWIVPDATEPILRAGNAGISFAYRTALFRDGLSFVPSSCEDVELLQRIHAAGHPILVSSMVTYFVREYAVSSSSGFPPQIL